MNVLCCTDSKRYAEMLHGTHSHTCFIPTFQESVSCDGEERQLQESLAVDERLEPLGGLQHQGVSEGGRVPLQQLRQLQTEQSCSQHTGCSRRDAP